MSEFADYKVRRFSENQWAIYDRDDRLVPTKDVFLLKREAVEWLRTHDVPAEAEREALRRAEIRARTERSLQTKEDPLYPLWCRYDGYAHDLTRLLVRMDNDLARAPGAAGLFVLRGLTAAARDQALTDGAAILAEIRRPPKGEDEPKGDSDGHPS